MTRVLVNARLKGSSLIEVIVAMVIISMVFSLAIAMYLNIQNSFFSSNLVFVNAKLNELIESAVITKKSGEIKQGELIFYYTNDDKKVAGIRLLRIEARDKNGKLLKEIKKVFYDPSPK